MKNTQRRRPITIVCWDGKTLAADRRVTSGHTISTTTKIFRTKDGIIGFAGCASGINAFLAWFNNTRDAMNFPEILYDPDYGVFALFINQQKEIWEFDYNCSPYLLTAKYVAIGSGDETALACMACGKTSAEAVKIVSKLNSSCGNGIDVLTLKDTE